MGSSLQRWYLKPWDLIRFSNERVCREEKMAENETSVMLTTVMCRLVESSKTGRRARAHLEMWRAMGMMLGQKQSPELKIGD